jgi:hypothetical protein
MNTNKKFYQKIDTNKKVFYQKRMNTNKSFIKNE